MIRKKQRGKEKNITESGQIKKAKPETNKIGQRQIIKTRSPQKKKIKKIKTK